MKIALIITETTKERSSHFLALELDERLNRLGMKPEILDLADPSYKVKDLHKYDAYLLVGTSTGPLYSNETHQLLTNNRQVWRNRRVASVMVSGEKMLADAADIQLKLVLKTLGANLLPDQLVVVNAENKFDQFLNLMDRSLNSKIDQFLYFFVYGSNSMGINKKLSA